MNCPKCNGEMYVSDEEFSALAEKVQPPKLVVKTSFVCKSCYEKFTRVVVHNLDAKTDNMSETGTMNRILGELNFPEQSTRVDQDVFNELSSIDPMKSDENLRTMESGGKPDRLRFTDL